MSPHDHSWDKTIIRNQLQVVACSVKGCRAVLPLDQVAKMLTFAVDAAAGLLKWADHTAEGYHGKMCSYVMRWHDDPESICDCGLWPLKERALTWLQKIG